MKKETKKRGGKQGWRERKPPADGNQTKVSATMKERHGDKAGRLLTFIWSPRKAQLSIYRRVFISPFISLSPLLVCQAFLFAWPLSFLSLKERKKPKERGKKERNEWQGNPRKGRKEKPRRYKYRGPPLTFSFPAFGRYPFLGFPWAGGFSISPALARYIFLLFLPVFPFAFFYSRFSLCLFFVFEKKRKKSKGKNKGG